MRFNYFIIGFSLFLNPLFGYSQKDQTVISPGIHFSIPVYTIAGENNTTGVGANAIVEHYFSNRFSGCLDIGYDHFTGNLIYWNNAIDHSFNIVPVLVGFRYYLQKFYLGLEAGAAIKASKNVYTNATICPSAGIKLKRWDAGIKLVSVLSMPSIPENTFLQRGGYGWLVLGLTYSLSH